MQISSSMYSNVTTSTRINSSSVHTYIFRLFYLRVILQGFVTQNATLSTTGLNVSCVQNSNLFLKWGGMSKWVLWGRTVLGVMPPVHVQGPVCPDHVAASAWLPVSWLCRFGCPPVQWCPVGRSPPCVGSIPEQWMITPNTPGTV